MHQGSKAAPEQNRNSADGRHPAAGPNPVAQKAAVCNLNDALRQTGRGGRVVMTAGVAALSAGLQTAVLQAVAAFDAFGPANDPHEEHDFGRLEVGGQVVLFKIDYYDLGLTFHSPDPADPAVTCRVLTVMLADEY